MIEIKGLDHAIQTIEKRFSQSALQAKCLELAKRLCEVGQPILESGFKRNATIYLEPMDDGYKIVVDGEDVLFIEFGTGDSAGIHATEYDAVPEVVRPGSWSETHAHQYENWGYWFWAGKKWTETEPHPYTFDAYKAMVEALPKIAAEVFSK